VQICAEAKMDRDRLPAARDLLGSRLWPANPGGRRGDDRERLSELSIEELTALNVRLVSLGAVDAERRIEEAMH
jgi:hypothetical protein